MQQLKQLIVFLVTVYRYGKYYMENGEEKRTLMKVFGIRLNVIVQSMVSDNCHFKPKYM